MKLTIYPYHVLLAIIIACVVAYGLGFLVGLLLK